MEDFDQGAVLAEAAALPTLPGTVIVWAGIDADYVRRWLYDQGWLMADGARLPQLQFLLLWFFLREEYGSDAPDEFRIPDLRGRAPIGAGSGVDLRHERRLGEYLGREDPSFKDLGFKHRQRTCGGGGCGYVTINVDSRLDVLQPSVVVNYIIYFGSSTMRYDDLLGWQAGGG